MSFLGRLGSTGFRPLHASLGLGTLGVLGLVIGACSAGNPEAANPNPVGPGVDAARPEDSGNDGGDAGDAEPDGSVGELDANFENVDAALFLCHPQATWSAGQAAPGLPTGMNAIALAVTADELSAAWIEDAAGTYSYHVADRASTADPFAGAQALPVAGSVAPLGLSLSPDGLRLALVKSDRTGFLVATRASRGMAFGGPTDTEFGAINQWADSINQVVADPAYSNDGLSVFYSQWSPAPMTPAPATVNESRSTTGATGAMPWPIGMPMDDAPLGALELPAAGGGTDTFRRHPISLSQDGLTVFISDDYPGAPPTARAVYRTSKTAKFTMSVALGAPSAWLTVHSNAACSRLYYVENGEMKFSNEN